MTVALHPFDEAMANYQAITEIQDSHPFHDTRGTDPEYERRRDHYSAVARPKLQTFKQLLYAPARNVSDIAATLNIVKYEYQDVPIDDFIFDAIISVFGNLTSAPNDLDCQAPDWRSAHGAWLAAWSAGRQYHWQNIGRHIDHVPAGPDRNAAIDAIPSDVWDEDERHTEVVDPLEDALMKAPSPGPAEFALKFLIARGDSRDADRWDDILESEARQFAGWPRWPYPAHAQEAPNAAP